MDEDASLEAQLRTVEPVGARLRVLRQRTGCSLCGLAQAAGMDPGYLSRVENSLVPPPAATTWEAYVAAWVGLTEDERYELDRLTSGLAARLTPGQAPRVIRRQWPIQRERHSAAGLATRRILRKRPRISSGRSARKTGRSEG